MGLLINPHDPVATPACHRHRRNLIGKIASLNCRLRALQRGDGERILPLTGQALVSGRILGEGPHQSPRIIGILKAV